jgi:hypothetical protein
MDKLQWFKFSHTEWMMGKIQRCPELTQIRYVKLICLYWKEECNLSIEDAELEIEKEHLDILIAKKVIKIDGKNILIDFMNEQMESILKTSKKNTEAVKSRWEKQKKRNTIKENSTTNLYERNTTVLPNDTDKIRVDKDKINKGLLSEVKTSDVPDDLKEYYKIALEFQKLFIKNQTDRSVKPTHQLRAAFKNYVDPIRLILQQDEATKEDLLDIYDFLNSNAGTFWKENILSTSKLREKLPTLLMQARKPKTKQNIKYNDKL